MVKIIVNADDFGVHRHATEAILDCFASGDIDRTTLMVNGNLKIDSQDLEIFHCVVAKVRRFFKFSAVPSVINDPVLVKDTGFYISRCAVRLNLAIGLWRKICAAIGSLSDKLLRERLAI